MRESKQQRKPAECKPQVEPQECRQQAKTQDLAPRGSIPLDPVIKAAILDAAVYRLREIQLEIGNCLYQEDPKRLADAARFGACISRAQTVVALASKVLSADEKKECGISAVDKILRFAQTTLRGHRLQKEQVDNSYSYLDFGREEPTNKYEGVLHKLPQLVKSSLDKLSSNIYTIDVGSGREEGRRSGGWVFKDEIRDEAVCMSKPEKWEEMARKLKLLK